MIYKINTIEDVKTFAKQLTLEGTSFHPDDDFNNYINIETEEPCYTQDAAGLRNKLMKSCFLVCENFGVDIYDIMLEITLEKMF